MAVDRLNFDTNVFIYAFENNDSIARELLRLISLNTGRKRPFLATSEITLAELVVDPLKRKDGRLIDLYDNISIGNSYIMVGTVTRDVLWHAAQLRSEHASLRLPDAIHLATALHFGCTRFLTGDTKLRNTYSIGVNPLVPSELAGQIAIARPDLATLAEIISGIDT